MTQPGLAAAGAAAGAAGACGWRAMEAPHWAQRKAVSGFIDPQLGQGDLFGRAGLVSADHLPHLAPGAFLQVAAALRADRRSGRVACATKWAVDIRPGLGDFLQPFVLAGLGALGLLKLDVLRLEGAAAQAVLLGAGVAAATLGTGPFQLDIAQGFL